MRSNLRGRPKHWAHPPPLRAWPGLFLLLLLLTGTAPANPQTSPAGFYFHAETRGPGHTTATNGWYAPGTTIAIEALPAPEAQFTGWNGDLDPARHLDNPLVLTLDRTRAIIALFAPATPAEKAPTTRYVATTGSHTAPFGSWETAATDIQSAIDAAAAGDEILVAPGVYAAGARTGFPLGSTVANRIVLDRPLTLRATDPQPGRTVIDAGGASATLDGTRCAYVGPGATLEGFTLTGGATSGSELSAAGGAAFIENGGRLRQCLVTENHAYRGGGIFILGDGEVQNSLIVSNTAVVGGAGIFLWDGGQVQNTLIDANRSRGGGAGAYLRKGGTLTRCLILNNASGGVILFRDGLLDTCLIAGNDGSFGAGAMLDGGGEVRNSVIMNNRARLSGGGLFIFDRGSIQNSTLAMNTARISGGGLATLNGGQIQNSILSHNHATRGDNWVEVQPGARFISSCTTPILKLPGTNNIDADPRFINPGQRDFRLAPDSPCIDAGTHAEWMTTATDLSGTPRILRDTVDIGAYEAPSMATPTNTTTAIDAPPAHTEAPTPATDNPTEAPPTVATTPVPPAAATEPITSPLTPVDATLGATPTPAPAEEDNIVLVVISDIQPALIVSPTPQADQATAAEIRGMRLTWAGKANASYTIEFSEDLARNFSTLTANLPGTGATQTYIDWTTTGPQRFYRIREQD